MADPAENPDFEKFLNQHKPQLEASGVPEIYWTRLHRKLRDEVFDAGAAFGIMRVEDEDEDDETEVKDQEGDVQTEQVKENSGSSWCVMVTKEDGVNIKDPEHIYLIDHAWTCQVSHARTQLESMPQLCLRMAVLMDVPMDGMMGASPELVQAVLDNMWRFNQTYQFGGLSQEDDSSLEPLWYIMDEFGAKVQHSDEPSVKTVPFYYVPNKTTYSLMWPILDLEFQDEVTRDYVAGTSDDLLRKTKLLPWIPENLMEEVSWKQAEPDSSYFEKFSAGETWPEKPTRPHLDRSQAIKVYSNMAQVVNNLSLEDFELVSDPSCSDILWIKESFSDFRSLYSDENKKYINQFPNEKILTVKDPLAVVARRACSRGESAGSAGLDTLPKWLPTTFNLVTDLPQFVSYFQNRQNKGADNHWILKPWNMARGLDMHITDNLHKVIRLAEGGPKVACKYIEDPVLFHRPEVGHVKYDIRYIVLLADTKPLKLYVYRVFWLRFANKPYDLEDLDDYEKHFTVMNYVNPANLKQIHFDEYITLFENQYPEFSWEQVESDIFEMFYELFSAAVNREAPAGLPFSPQSRAMYAIDLMLKWDTNSKGERCIQPMLCEVNFCPDCERACKYHPNFYNDVFSALFLDDIVNRPVKLLENK